MYNNQYMLDNLTRQKERIDEMIRTYQQPQPVNNIFNAPQTPSDNLYEIKVLNDGDEVENILVGQNTLFLGTNRLQIKKTDGSIEKYNIEKTFPIDPKDKKIKELNQKVEELERRLNNEHTEFTRSTNEIDKPNANVDELAKSKSKTTSK